LGSTFSNLPLPNGALWKRFCSNWGLRKKGIAVPFKAPTQYLDSNCNPELAFYLRFPCHNIVLERTKDGREYFLICSGWYELKNALENQGILKTNSKLNK
tara:strand:- start:1080 stop:1379 length:300 start_codon:yes stop_codon:yes gene_type:complete